MQIEAMAELDGQKNEMEAARTSNPRGMTDCLLRNKGYHSTLADVTAPSWVKNTSSLVRRAPAIRLSPIKLKSILIISADHREVT